MKRKLMAILLSASMILGGVSTVYAEGEEATDMSVSASSIQDDSGTDDSATENTDMEGVMPDSAEEAQNQIEDSSAPEDESNAESGNISLVSVSDTDLASMEFYDHIDERDMKMDIDLDSISLASISDTNTYYGDQLSGVSAEMYAAMENVTAEQNGFALTYDLDGMTAQECYTYLKSCCDTALTAFMYDHPDKLYFNSMNGISFGASYTSVKMIFKGSYVVSSYYTADLESQAEAVVDSVVAGDTGTSRYEKLQYLHDWLVSQCSYDSDALSEANTSEHFYYAHGPLGCLLNNTGVCESYAKSFKIFCSRLDLTCVYVTSDTHAFNYVQMDNGIWYMIDCTFDDPTNGQAGQVYYDYFLVANDPAVDDDHVEDSEAAYPQVSSEDYSVEDYKAAQITAQPESVTTALKTKATFTVTAENVASYQWQYSKNNGQTWTNLKDTSASSSYINGVATDSMTILTTNTRCGYVYRCQIEGTDGGVIYTDTVTLSKIPELSITTQPVDTVGSLMKKTTFTVVAENAVSYQWQYSKNNGSSWNTLKDSTSSSTYIGGSTTDTLTLYVNNTRSGYVYRCKVTGLDGTVKYTDQAAILLFTITAQPESVQAKSGNTVTFKVEADNAASYQWYYQKEGSTSWNKLSDNTKSSMLISGSTTDTITIKMTKTRVTFKYRCKVTGEDGTSKYTDVVGIIS